MIRQTKIAPSSPSLSLIAIRIGIGMALSLLLGMETTHASDPSTAPATLKVSPPSPVAEAGLRILLERIADFRERTRVWLRTLEKDSGAVPGEGMRASLDSLRRTYKGFELAVETLQPQVQEKFNGAPLPFLNPDNLFKVEIESPVGLQVLENEIYAGRIPMDSLRRRLAGLMGACDELRSMLRQDPPDDARLWEAMENQAVQVLTLGLAGYDSPASGRALIESGEAIGGLLELVRLYRMPLDARSRALFPALQGRILEASRRLMNAGDFDAFDRLDFIRKAGNPLLAGLVDARTALGLVRSGSLPGTTKTDRAFPIPARAVHPEARGIFDPDFLDPGFFALDYQGNPRRQPSRAGMELGRSLFFDPILSGDNKRACSSCHRPASGFAEPLPKSLGFKAAGSRGAQGKDPAGALLQTGSRNAPSLHYAAFQRFQFWDMREALLEDQIGHVIQGHQEFKTTFHALLAKLEGIPEYAAGFARAFPGEGPRPLNRATVASALAQYMRSLSAFNSPFDRYARGESDTLDPKARRGFNVFMGKAACGTCHFPPVFNGTVPPLYRETESEVLGVPASDDTASPELDRDPGRYALRREEQWRRARKKGYGYVDVWRGAFKTPTVRNVSLTAPYMHNGAFPTLESVVRFYDAGGGSGLGLEVPNQTLPADSLGLSAREREDLIAFMRSLTDDPPRSDKPEILPAFPAQPHLNRRLVGGEY